MDSKIAPIAESSFLFWGSKQKTTSESGKMDSENARMIRLYKKNQFGRANLHLLYES